VIGVHTPGFSFEHDVGNVCRAVTDLSVDYPVAIDNDGGRPIAPADTLAGVRSAAAGARQSAPPAATDPSREVTLGI
jgi:hypothetical protein